MGLERSAAGSSQKRFEIYFAEQQYRKITVVKCSEPLLINHQRSVKSPEQIGALANVNN